MSSESSPRETVDGEPGGDRRRGQHPRPPAPEPLPAPVTDSHCHLDIAAGPDGGWLAAEEAISAASAVGVGRIVQIGCDLRGARWAVSAAERWPGVVAGVALHPNEAPRLAAAGRLDEALAEIERLASSSGRVRAVGETGLDYFRTGPEGRTTQEESFRAHIELARRLDKTLVIHDRDAHADVIRVLEDAGPPERVVFHCFSGDAEMASYCAQRGWFLSFAGNVTFKNASSLRAALAGTPMDAVLVETDAPYLTPHPYRGRPNSSYLIPHTVRKVAEVLGRDLKEVCETIEANTTRAFHLDPH